jgi:hypothetical protein
MAAEATQASRLHGLGFQMHSVEECLSYRSTALDFVRCIGAASPPRLATRDHSLVSGGIMFRSIAFLMTAALSIGCSSTKPDQTLSVSNAGYSLDKLFTDPNGYSIYRFFDRGDFHYYVVGPGGAHMVPGTTTRDSNAEVGVGFGTGLGEGVGVGAGVSRPIGSGQ